MIFSCVPSRFFFPSHISPSFFPANKPVSLAMKSLLFNRIHKLGKLS